MIAFLMSFSFNTIKSIKSKIIIVENTIDNADETESDDERVKKELEIDEFLHGFHQIIFNNYFESSQSWKTIQVDYFSVTQKINVPPPKA